MPESAASIKGIEFEIRGSATKAANGLEKLSKSLSELKKITAGNAGLASLAKDLASFGKSVENLSSTNIKNVASSLGKIGKQSDKIWEVAEYLNTISMLDFSNLSDAAKNISAIGQSTKTLGQTGGGKDANWKETLFSDFGVNQPVAGTSSSTIREACKGQAELTDSSSRTSDAINTTARNYRDMAESLEKLAENAKTTSSSFVGLAKNIALLPFKKAAESVKNFANKILSVGAAFKRILYYRMIRTIIKEIGAAFRTGVNNLYAWSQMADGRFAASMDRMATAMLYFKNSIGAMVAPLLNALAPALDYVIDKVVDFLNIINQLFAKLTGASYWTRAIKQATTYSDAASSAGSAAKDAMRYLAPFDELNVLPSDKNNGSGGGTSGNDYGGMFEIVEQFDQTITDFANGIRTAIENGDWEGLGSILGGKINDLIESVPWADLGASFGSFVNGIISTEYWTLDEINFTKIGEDIAEFVNNAIANVNFDIAGRLPVKKLTSIIDVIGGFLGNLNWAGIAAAISDFLCGALNELSDWFSEVNWVDVGKQLFNAIYDFIANIKWEDLAEAIARFLGTLGGSVISAFAGVVSGAWDKWWGDFVEEGRRKVQEEGQNPWVVAINVVVDWVIDTLTAPIDLYDWFNEHVVTPYQEAVAEVIGIDINSTGWKIGKSLIDNFGLGMLETLPGIGPIISIAKFIKEWLEPDEEGKSNLQSAIEAWVLAIKNGFILAWNTIVGVIAESGFGEWLANYGIDIETWKIDIDVTGNVTELQDKLTENKRQISTYARIDEILKAEKKPEVDASAKLSDLDSSGLTDTERTVNNVHGNLVKLDRSNIPKSDTTIPTTADYTDWSVNGSKSGSAVKEFTTWKSTANYTDYQVGGSKSSEAEKKFTTWKSTANYVDYEVEGSKTDAALKKFTTWRSTANYTDWSVDGSKADSVVKKFATWSSTANYTDYQVHGSKSDTVKKAFTTWSSTANWTDTKDSLTTAQHGIGMYANLDTWYRSTKWLPSYNGIDMYANVTDVQVSDKAVSNLKAKLSTSLSISAKARGGIFSGGVWHSIPQYAGGTSRAHGSLFIAGEAGPEIVGHIGGRTEVLNQSQIAASISAGMARALSSVRFHMSGLSATTIPTYEEDEDTEELMYRATVRALQYLGISGDIAAHISEDEVYESVKDSNRRNTRRTGINELARA